MAKHVAKMDSDGALNELRARLSMPGEWPGLADAVRYLIPLIGKGRHTYRTGGGMVRGVIPTAWAMRDWYREN